MKLGTILGVKLKIHPFLLLLGAIYAWLGLGVEVLLVLAVVLLHEMAHLFTAWGMGVTIQEVELFPFGGQARMEDFTGMDPEKEIVVALAGPACSFTLAALFYFLIPYLSANSQLSMFVQMNAMLGGFNMLPVLPLDGGRIVRAMLSRSQGYKKATSRMAGLGQAAGILLILGGIYMSLQALAGLNILAAGGLLFWSARREGKLLAYSFMRYLVNKKGDLAHKGLLPAQQYVSRPDTLVKVILQSSTPNGYMLVIVIDDQHQVQRMITEAELIECLLEKGPSARINDC